jgi:hypothetical protein
MATFSLNDTVRRAISTGNGSTTSFAFSFQINAIADIKVYVDGTLKTQGTGSANYAVQNGSGVAGLTNTGTGSVVFVTAPSNATTITILSDIPLSRTSLYTSGGNVTASALEDDFDTITMALGDREERDARSLQAPVQDPISINMTLPAKANRLGKVLGFNSSTGNPEGVSQLTTAGVTVSTVTVGGSATASVSTSGNTATFALGIPTGATGATGIQGQSGYGLSMTWDTDTSDADSGNGKIFGNNSTISSISILYLDDVDDSSVNIASFVQAWDDVANSTARGYIQITKEGTASTYAIFKINNAITDASGYSKIPVTHVVSNGTFSDAMGVTVAFVQSGADGSGAMNSFIVAGSSGDNQTITNGNTLNIVAGANITTTGSSTDTITIACTLDDPVSLAIALG